MRNATLALVLAQVVWFAPAGTRCAECNPPGVDCRTSIVVTQEVEWVDEYAHEWVDEAGCHHRHLDSYEQSSYRCECGYEWTVTRYTAPCACCGYPEQGRACRERESDDRA